MEEKQQRNTPDAPDVFSAVNHYFLLFFCGSCVLSSMYIQQIFLMVDQYRMGIAVSSLVGIILPSYLLTRRFPAGFRAQMRIRWPRVHRLLLVMVATAAAVVLIDQVYVITQRLSPVPDDYAEAINELRPTTAGQFVLTFLGLCLLVPVAEELVFRGLIQQILARNLGPTLGVALTAALFGAIHLNAHLLVSITAFGLLLGYIFHVTGNLFYTVVAHSVFNTAALIQLALVPESRAGDLPVYLQDVRIVVAALVVFVFLLFKIKEGGSETEPPMISAAG